MWKESNMKQKAARTTHTPLLSSPYPYILYMKKRAVENFKYIQKLAMNVNVIRVVTINSLA